MSDLIIIGGGGHAKVVADIAVLCGYNVLGFLDDDATVRELIGYKRLGTVEECVRLGTSAQFFIAIGNNAIRRKIYEKYELNYATLIHPSAVIGSSVKIGKGTVVMAGTVINACAQIGDFCVVNTGSVIEHDCVIGDFTFIAPHSTVCGFSQIGKNCWIGVNAAINNVIKICDNVTVGSGAVIIKNIDEMGTYVGAPAKLIKNGEK